MFTPISTASTAAGPRRDQRQKHHQHRGQVVDDVGQHRRDRGDRREARAGLSRSAARRASRCRGRGSITASTTTPRHSTNARNGTSIAASDPRDRRVAAPARPRTPRTTRRPAPPTPGNARTAMSRRTRRGSAASTTRTNTGTSARVSARRRRCWLHRQVATENPTQKHELDGDRGQPGQRHDRGEVQRTTGPPP